VTDPALENIFSNEVLMNRYLLFLGCVFSGALHAGSVHLINDSPYVLRAVVRGNDGSFLGEQVIEPQNSGDWSDNSEWDTYQNPEMSQTPYTVIWYCMSGGGDYSITTYVATGSTVFAQSGEGARICNPQQRQGQSQQQQQQQNNSGSSEDEEDEE
jgi:hypothetical protein